ncbi:MAG: hypothetical protein ACOC1K_05215, partial [Nanoarchaeota archaeon]
MAYTFEYPYVLFLILPLLLLLLLLLKHDFLKLEMDKSIKRRLKKHRLIILFSRIIIFSLLILAIASPYLIENKMVQGDPYLTVLIDNSSSFDLYSKQSGLIKKLTENIETNVEYINTREETALGDSLLKVSKDSDNILLISDGQNNRGADLSDVSVFFVTENITMHTIED